MLQVGKVIKDFKKAGYEPKFPNDTGMIHFVKEGSKDIVFNSIVSDELFGVGSGIAGSIDEAIEMAGGMA